MANRDHHRHGTGQGPQGDGLDDGTFNLAGVGAALGLTPDFTGLAQDATDSAATRDAPPVRQIVFIEGDVPDAQLLAAGVAPGVLAVILDPNQDGVTQIAQYLASHDLSSLTSINIVAHGQDGQVSLGSGTLSSATLAQYQTDLTAIGAALAPGGDLQIYGCDVGQDAAGVAFLDQLSAATGGANVAASSNLVGAAADGGNWTLDVNVGNPVVTDPFTAAAQAAYPDVLAASTDELFAVYFDDDSVTGTRIEELGVTSTGTYVNGSTVDVVSTSKDSALTVPGGFAIDAAREKYFTVVDDASSVNEILTGTVGGGNPTVLYNPGIIDGAGNYDLIGQLALNEPGGQLYFTKAAFNSTTDANVPSASGVYSINAITGGGVTLVASGAYNPTGLALDTTNNLVFVVNTYGGVADTLNYASLTPGSTLHSLNSQLPSAIQTQLADFAGGGEGSALTDVAVNAATQTLYFTAEDEGATTDSSSSSFNFIDSVHYTVSGGVVTLGSSVTTLYSGSGAGSPQSITIDPQDGIFYVDNGFTSGSSALAITEAIEEGSLTHTGAGSVATVFSYSQLDAVNDGNQSEPNSFDGSSFAQGIALVSVPTVVASGTVSVYQGQAATAIGSAPTVSNSDGQDLASATVVIVGGTSSDVLSATNAGAITTSYNAATQTLTLTGVDTLADYQTVLDSVKFTTTGATGTRTIDWTLNGGTGTSPTATSTVNVTAREVVTAGATATFTGGQSAVVLDSGLTISDQGGSTLVSATVVIGGYITGDTLAVGTPGGLSQSFSNGTLTLSGSASLATYQTALESVAYSTTPTNADPTGGGSHTSRTISWSINDGTVTSTAATSTLNEIHVAPTIATSGTVTYTGPSAVTLDAVVTATDSDSSGNLAGATVQFGSGFTSGDALVFTNQNGITGSYNAGTGVLTLSGTTSIANYEAALESVKYDTTNASHATRTIDWSTTDGAATSNTSTSTVDVICFCVGTLIGTPEGEVPVQALQPGDMVLTAHNGPRKVIWVGTGKVLATRGHRSAATPVIVRKDALADNVPYRDLRVTKAHSLYIDDVLIPVEFLVNHKTILWDDHAMEVEIYHVELESHDVLIANGVPAESFRDDGNRWLFQNARSGWDLPPQEPCAPVLTGGPVVDAAWRRFLNRAGPRDLPPLTDDADLHLIIDGQRVDARERKGAVHIFRLPSGPTSVFIASRSGVPCEFGIARDPRPLGVALRQVRIQQRGKFMLLQADDERLMAGFHDYEPAASLRWTDGYAELPIDLFAPFDQGAEVMLLLGGATKYPDYAEDAGQAAA
jgi:hypothetical protein